jgi:hypothetical protein
MRKILRALMLLAFVTPLLASSHGCSTRQRRNRNIRQVPPPKNVTPVIEEQGDNLQVTADGANDTEGLAVICAMAPMKRLGDWMRPAREFPICAGLMAQSGPVELGAGDEGAALHGDLRDLLVAGVA